MVVSVGANCLYYLLLRYSSAVKVNSLFYLVPTVTALLCYYFFGQAIDGYIVSGIVLTLGGVLITHTAGRSKQISSAEIWENKPT